MLDENALFRSRTLGRFDELLLGVTKDPAMLSWLSGIRNTRFAPNENYARELMELFTLGAGRGYTENDVREQARALTGWRVSRRPGVGPYDFRFEPRLHDSGTKTVFAGPATSTGRTPAGSVSSTPTILVLRPQAVELHRADGLAAPTQADSSGCTGTGTRSAPLSRRSSSTRCSTRGRA